MRLYNICTIDVTSYVIICVELDIRKTYLKLFINTVTVRLGEPEKFHLKIPLIGESFKNVLQFCRIL